MLAVAWRGPLLFCAPIGLLVCLLCHWLVGRVFSLGQENDYQLPGAWKGPFVEQSVERAVLRQGSYWICGVFPHNF